MGGIRSLNMIINSSILLIFAMYPRIWPAFFRRGLMVFKNRIARSECADPPVPDTH